MHTLQDWNVFELSVISQQLDTCLVLEKDLKTTSVKTIIFLSFGRKELRGTIAVANNSLQSGKKMLIRREQSRQQLHSIPRYSKTLYCFIVLIIGTNYGATQMVSDLLESLHYDFLWWGLSNKCEESEQWRRRNKKVTQWDPIGGVG